MDDPRPMVAVALDQVDDLVAGLRPDALERSTPCSGFDLRALLGHLLAVLAWLTRIGSEGSAQGLAPARAAQVDDAAWPVAWAAARGEYERVWADSAVLDRVLSSPWATLPGRLVLPQLVPEVVMHSWDLAAALGRADGLEEDLARFSLSVVRRSVPERSRPPGGPFGPVVPVPPDAPAYDRLAGWLGRRAA